MGDMENTTTPTAQMDMSNHTSNMTDQLEDMGNGSHSDHSQDPHATHLGYDPENKHVNVLVMDHVHDDNNHHMHHPDAHMDQSSCYWVTDDALFSKMCFQVFFEESLEELATQASFCKKGNCMEQKCLHFAGTRTLDFPKIGDVHCHHYHCGDEYGHLHHDRTGDVKVEATTRTVHHVDNTGKNTISKDNGVDVTFHKGKGDSFSENIRKIIDSRKGNTPSSNFRDPKKKDKAYIAGEDVRFEQDTTLKDLQALLGRTRGG